MRALLAAAAFVVLGGAAQADNVTFGQCVVSVETADGAVRYDAEYAANSNQRQRGLMFRETMEKRTGMLFRFDQDREVSMWMKNTYLPLDMVFIAPDGRIGHIHRSAVPRSLDVISSRGITRHVLELNAGEADADGLAAGQPVTVACED